MIYVLPAPGDALDQGDLIDGCPVFSVLVFDPANPAASSVKGVPQRIVVLTQTCDLANEKTAIVTVAEVYEAQLLVNEGLLKPADIKGPLRSGRIWGLYFLPASAELHLGEMIVDLRRLHTVRRNLLQTLCQSGQRRARIVTPYREHLAKHFGDTFTRIGLPQPYETL
jgi:hypothetical protein